MKQLVKLMQRLALGRRRGDRSRTTGRQFLRPEVLEKRQLLVGELLKLELNARTATDGAFSASDFNTTTRQLTIGVGEIFNLEVLYRDLRTPVNQIGAFAIYADLLYDTANANNLVPVLTETQFLELSANLFDASDGTIDFTFPNTTSVVSVSFADFALNQAGSIRAAIQSLGYSNVSVEALGRNFADPFRYLIRYDDFALADQDIPNLIVTPRLDLTVISTVTDEKPRNQNGSINSRAVPLNINFHSRTLPAGAGDTFFGFAGTRAGNFSAATGFSDLGATGPLLTTGWPGLNTGTPLPNPFDAFSIPVKMTNHVTDMRLVIDPPNTSATANLLYGIDEPITSSQIIIDTAASPATAAGATGVIFITATSGDVVTVSAADSSLDAVQSGPAVPIDLRQLVTVAATSTLPTFTIKTPPTKGTVSVVNGVHQYTPNPGAVGLDTFVYTATVDSASDDGTISVSIAPEQVQLTAGNGSLTTFRNGLPVSIDLATLVTTTPANTPVTYSIVQNPSFGQVGLTSESLATYTPPAGQSGTTSFRYRITSVNDPTVFAEGVIDVTATNVNSAPTVAGNALLPAVSEDAANPVGASVLSLLGGNFQDADAGDGLRGIVLTANAAALSQGRWQWLNGTTWSTIATTYTETAGVFFAAATMLRFLPAANYNGTPGSLTMRLVDSSATSLIHGRTVNVSVNGGTTPFSAATVTLGTSVTAVNDAPLATGSATLTATTEDATNPPGATVATLFAGRFSDAADAVAGGGAHTLAGVVLTANAATAAQGRWQWLDGATWQDVATSLTQAAGLSLTAATSLRFLPAAHYNGTPGSLTARLVDSSAAGLTNGALVNASLSGGTTPYSAATVTLGTSVTAVKDAPLATGSATLAAILEDATNPPGATVATLFAGNFSDTADAVPGGSTANTFIGIVLTGNAATTAQGRWQWLNGTTWSNIATSYTDSAGVFFTAATMLRFLPVANFNGTPGPLTVRLVDSSAIGLTNARSANVSINGGATAYSAASVKLGTTVTAVNDAPLATGAATLPATAEDTTNPPGATVAYLFAGNFSDAADAVPGSGEVTTRAGVVITGNAAPLSQGRWQWLNGSTWSTIATTYTETAGVFFTAATMLRFLPAANFNGTPGPLTVRLVDSSATSLVNARSANASINGGTTPFSAATVTLGTSVTAVNDAPLATGLATLAATTQDATDPPGSTVASLFAGNFSDAADAVSGGSAANTLAGVVLTANAATAAQGRWQWLDGSTWKEIGTSLSPAAGLYLAAPTSIRFLPAVTFTGTPGALAVRLVDSTATGLVNGGPANVSTSGGVTPFSTANVLLGTSVTAAINNQA